MTHHAPDSERMPAAQIGPTSQRQFNRPDSGTSPITTSKRKDVRGAANVSRWTGMHQTLHSPLEGRKIKGGRALSWSAERSGSGAQSGNGVSGDVLVVIE